MPHKVQSKVRKNEIEPQNIYFHEFFFLNYFSRWRALLTDIIPTSEPTDGGAGGLGVTCGITSWGVSGSWTTTIPNWQLAASGALQVLILLSKWSPEGHGMASYFPWLQIKNEEQSFGFGAKIW